MVSIPLFGLLSWCGVRWKQSQHLAGGAVGAVVSVSQNEATDWVEWQQWAMTVIMVTIWTVESEDVCWSAALNNEQNKTKNNPAALWLSPQIVPSEKTPKSLLVIWERFPACISQTSPRW